MYTNPHLLPENTSAIFIFVAPHSLTELIKACPNIHPNTYDLRDKNLQGLFLQFQ